MLHVNSDFLKIKPVDGDIKLSHKKRNYGLTVTTQEFIFHKPHINYYVKYEDLISIVHFDAQLYQAELQHHKLLVSEHFHQIETHPTLYKLMIRNAVIHNRSGLFPIGLFDLIIPIHHRLFQAIVEYSGLRIISTESSSD